MSDLCMILWLRWCVGFVLSSSVVTTLVDEGDGRCANCLRVCQRLCSVTFEPRHANTCLRGFRPGKIQSVLLSYSS